MWKLEVWHIFIFHYSIPLGKNWNFLTCFKRILCIRYRSEKWIYIYVTISTEIIHKLSKVQIIQSPKNCAILYNYPKDDNIDTDISRMGQASQFGSSGLNNFVNFFGSNCKLKIVKNKKTRF